MMHETQATVGAPLALDIPEADVRLWPNALATGEADEAFRVLRDTIAWQQEQIVIFGRRHAVPRLVAWHGDDGAAYT